MFIESPIVNITFQYPVGHSKQYEPNATNNKANLMQFK